MPRSENKNTYHFKVKQINNDTYKYYHTAKAITEDLGIPRSSIYKIMSRDIETKYYTYPFIKIDKISVPKEKIIKEIYELRIRNLIEQKYNDDLSTENWLSV
tara:strand:- start:1256 stop:1561 length:306 start_codon:yes stop_codon:yes gene_type:complete